MTAFCLLPHDRRQGRVRHFPPADAITSRVLCSSNIFPQLNSTLQFLGLSLLCSTVDKGELSPASLD